MCISRLFDRAEADEFLCEKPDPFHVYKVAVIKVHTRPPKGGVFGLIMEDVEYFPGVNRITDPDPEILQDDHGQIYEMGYHFYTTYEDAEHVASLYNLSRCKIFKVLVYKKHIVGLGKTCFKTIVVASEFIFPIEEYCKYGEHPIYMLDG